MACPSCACRKLKLKCRRECIHWRQKTLVPFLATLIIMCLICFSHLLHFFKMGWNPISLLKVWKIKEKHVCKGDPYQYNRSLHFKNKQKAYILLKVVRHWHRLPRDIVECLSLEIFKTELDVVLGCPGLPALRRGLDRLISTDASNLSKSVTLWDEKLTCSKKKKGFLKQRGEKHGLI